MTLISIWAHGGHHFEGSSGCTFAAEDLQALSHALSLLRLSTSLLHSFPLPIDSAIFWLVKGIKIIHRFVLSEHASTY